MRKSILLIALLWVSSCLWAWTSPVTVPSVGDARLHIVGQNTQNYLMNLEASNSSCYDEAEFAAKTNNMANVFLTLEADIVALCEVEENDEILGILVNEMNSLYGQNVYTYREWTWKTLNRDLIVNNAYDKNNFSGIKISAVYFF